MDLYEFLEYKILDELKFKASIAGSFNLQKYQSFRPAILDVNGRRKSTNQDDTKTSWTHEDILTYNKTFNKDHTLTALGGFSLQEFKTEMTKLAVVDNISDAIEISNAYGGVDMTNTKATWTANRLASFLDVYLTAIKVSTCLIRTCVMMVLLVSVQTNVGDFSHQPHWDGDSQTKSL